MKTVLTEAIDRHGRVWKSQYGLMWANAKKTIRKPKGDLVIEEGQILRHQSDISWV